MSAHITAPWNYVDAYSTVGKVSAMTNDSYSNGNVQGCDIIEEIQLRNVRLHILFDSRRLLGDPCHCLAKCIWTRTEVRLAADGYGYTYREFEEEHGEWAFWCWKRSKCLNPSLAYYSLRKGEQYLCHISLLRILREKNDILRAKKVLTSSVLYRQLPHHIQRIIASFSCVDQAWIRAMTYTKNKKAIKNKRLQKRLPTAPPAITVENQG